MTTELTDKSLIYFGKYKGTALTNIPADYLLYLYNYNNCKINANLRVYIKDNFDVLNNEIMHNNEDK